MKGIKPLNDEVFADAVDIDANLKSEIRKIEHATLNVLKTISNNVYQKLKEKDDEKIVQLEKIKIRLKDVEEHNMKLEKTLMNVANFMKGTLVSCIENWKTASLNTEELLAGISSSLQITVSETIHSRSNKSSTKSSSTTSPASIRTEPDALSIKIPNLSDLMVVSEAENYDDDLYLSPGGCYNDHQVEYSSKGKVAF